MTLGGRRIQIHGIVQGVGFRPWVYRLARQNGISGRVSNGTEGVTIDAFGAEEELDSFLRGLQANPPPAARIRELRWQTIPSEPAPPNFEIIDSRPGGERRVSIPADLATCDDCLSEIFDPSDRRYRYAFTNCTNCGPRFTIARDVPYDRPATTMAPFRMCAACQREYDSPLDRRFHAQPNACPKSGLYPPPATNFTAWTRSGSRRRHSGKGRSSQSRESAGSISRATRRRRRQSAGCASGRGGKRNPSP
jgi:hydrogenase maturation protein HypF